ncbi:MAG: aldose 1-epimerase family protein [Planctomycetaceae bacterium]|jgi:galactose mutarotase-like enzyme|nr:aldose 1-epimerase family protein [Planctomycetaceae bacterium]
MRSETWVLIDARYDHYFENFCYENTENDCEAKPRVPQYYFKRFTGGRCDCVDLVTIDNGLVSIDLLPTRGMGIQRINCQDVKLQWNSPNIRPVHPSFVQLSDPSGTGWLEGFTEWLVRCGLESNGAADFDENGKLLRPMHGRIANTPADFLQLEENNDTKEIFLNAKIYETKLFTKKFELDTTLRTTFHSTKFTIIDKITNLSAEPNEFQLLYHINTGQPFAAPGSRVISPFDRLAPQSLLSAENLPEWNLLGDEIKGSKEVVFYMEPAIDNNGNCKAMLLNPSGDRAILLTFVRDLLPYFILWKSRLDNADGYVCGFEPAVNFPNNYTFEKQQGRTVKLQPNESKTYKLDFEILMNAEAVKNAEEELKSIPAKNRIETTPPKEWSNHN